MEPSVEVVLNKLESLSRRDRRWVIERLPESAKAMLMNGRFLPEARNTAKTSPAMDLSIPASEESLCEFSPEVVAHALRSESAWIIEALLRNGDAAWRKQVLRHLPSSTRSSVMASMHAAVRITKPVQDSLRRSARRKIESSLPNAIVDDRPRWYRWLTVRPISNWIRS